MDINEIIANFSDDALRIAAAPFVGRASSLRAVRDNEGNLRELTDAERTFGAASKAEFRRRFLAA